MSEAAKIQLLLRRGILPQRILEPEAEVAEYVQSRVQDLALEIWLTHLRGRKTFVPQPSYSGS